MDSSSQGCSVGEPHVKYKEPPCFQTVPVKSPSFCLGPQASVVLEVAQRVPLSSQWTVLPGREGVVALCVTSSGGTGRLEANTSLRELKWSIPRQGHRAQSYGTSTGQDLVNLANSQSPTHTCGTTISRNGPRPL